MRVNTYETYERWKSLNSSRIVTYVTVFLKSKRTVQVEDLGGRVQRDISM